MRAADQNSQRASREGFLIEPLLAAAGAFDEEGDGHEGNAAVADILEHVAGGVTLSGGVERCTVEERVKVSLPQADE